jgi:hypothetical protein
MSEVRVVRRRRSWADAEALGPEFEASGLVREAFCGGEVLAVGTLDKYRWRVHGGPRIAVILSVVESCRRLKIPIRTYLADILPGLANASVQRIPDITPAA